MTFNHTTGRWHVRINDSDGWVTGTDEDEAIPFQHDGEEITNVQEIPQAKKNAISAGLRRMNREKAKRAEIENQQ